MKTNTTKKETKYNKVVNFDKETNEITVLDATFKYNDGFKGATGTRFTPVSKQEYDTVIDMSSDEIADYLIENGFELPKKYLKGGFMEWADDFEDDDKLSLFFNLSYSRLYDSIREQVGLTEDEAYIFNCTGGGRCFDSNFQGNVNPELSKVIRKFESK